MTTEIFLRYLHFISIFTIVASLVAEHLLLKNELTRAEVGRLTGLTIPSENCGSTTVK